VTEVEESTDAQVELPMQGEPHNEIRVKRETRFVVYYESRKRELKIRLMNEGRCDERLKTRVEESTYLTYTGFHDKTN
jgi:hypothetical protein